MAKKTNKSNKKKNNSKKAGLVAFGVTLLVYSLIFSFNRFSHFIIGGGLAALAGWIVNTMATPMKALDKNAKSKAALDVTIIEDEYARSVVEKGVEMLDAFKVERDAINEYVFTRRINETRENLDKVLRHIVEDPDKAQRIRKMNSYYLPTALKLLQGYRSAKQQGTSYVTMSETREDVLSTLDKLNEALVIEREAMVKDDLEDMDIEIDVFERMLKSDGLQEDDLTDALRESAHAAAKERPMSAAPAVKPTEPTPQAKSKPQPAAKPVQTRAPQSAPLQARAPRPAPVQTRAPQPAPFQTKAPQPAPVQARAPQPVPFQTKAPQPAPVQTRAPQSAPVQTRAPQPAVKPVQAKAPQHAPVQASVPQPAPVQAEYKPKGVALDYEVQVKEAVRTPVPTLNVPGATASARQLQQGAPVLQVPDSPGAPDFTDTIPNERKA